MKSLKISMLIGLTFFIGSLICIFLLINSHRVYTHALENNLPTASLRPIYMYDIVLFIVLGVVALVSLIVSILIGFEMENKS